MAHHVEMEVWVKGVWKKWQKKLLWKCYSN